MLKEMVINTNYARSISVQPRLMDAMKKYDSILVRDKATGRPLARLNTQHVLENARRVWLRDKNGKPVQSKYLVYSF